MYNKQNINSNMKLPQIIPEPDSILESIPDQLYKYNFESSSKSSHSNGGNQFWESTQNQNSERIKIFTPLRVGWPPTPQVYFGPWEGLRVVFPVGAPQAKNFHFPPRGGSPS